MATKRTYTITEAAELAGLSRKAVARRVERGSLRSVVRNGRRLIPRSELVRAGLVRDEGEERGMEPASWEPATPASSPEGEPSRALVSLVRELLERVERQANEIAQFRALTVQAESLRADRELAELRARVAQLENRDPDAQRHLRPAERWEHPRGAAGARPQAPNRIWLPPTAAPAPTRPTAAAPRPMPERPAAAPSSGWNRWVLLAVEAAFIVLVAVGAGLAQLSPPGIVAAIALAWGIVAVVEALAWRRRRGNLERQAQG